MYKSKCVWPPNAVPDGPVTYAEHPTLEDAVKACIMVRDLGYGGKRMIYPRQTSIIQPDGTEVGVVDRVDLNPVRANQLADVLKAIRNPTPLEPEDEGKPKHRNRRERRAEAAKARREGRCAELMTHAREPVRTRPNRIVVSTHREHNQKRLKALLRERGGK